MQQVQITANEIYFRNLKLWSYMKLFYKGGLKGKNGRNSADGINGKDGDDGSNDKDGRPGVVDDRNWRECAWNDLRDNKDIGAVKVCKP